MFSEIRHSYALLRAGRTLAAYDALMTPEQISQLPWAARLGLSVAKFGTRKPQQDGEKVQRDGAQQDLLMPDESDAIA